LPDIKESHSDVLTSIDIVYSDSTSLKRNSFDLLKLLLTNRIIGYINLI
jgi:hypothetical protein